MESSIFFLIYLVLLFILAVAKQNTVERAVLRSILASLFLVIAFFKVQGYPDYSVMSKLQSAPFHFGRNTALQFALKLTNFVPFELFYIATLFIGHLFVINKVIKSQQDIWYYAFFLPIIYAGFLKQGLAIIIMLVASSSIISLLALIHPVTMTVIYILRKRMSLRLLLFSLLLCIGIIQLFNTSYVQSVYVDRAYSSAMFTPILFLLLATNKFEKNTSISLFVLIILLVSYISSALSYRLLVIVFYFLFNGNLKKRMDFIADISVVIGFAGWWFLSPDSYFFL